MDTNHEVVFQRVTSEVERLSWCFPRTLGVEIYPVIKVRWGELLF